KVVPNRQIILPAWRRWLRRTAERDMLKWQAADGDCSQLVLFCDNRPAPSVKKKTASWMVIVAIRRTSCRAHTQNEMRFAERSGRLIRTSMQRFGTAD